jgi:glycosyltransferase involved in cell wall biosynthesis
LAGDGIDESNEQIAHWLALAGTREVTRLLGSRRDVPRLTAALDIATLCSTHEGFPNVLGEALACSVPCVTTDVGDAASIVAASGSVVPSGDASAVAAAWEALLRRPFEERCDLGEAGRKRIGEKFSLESVTQEYVDLYDEVSVR